MKNKTVIVRSVVVLLYILLGIYSYTTGKGFKVMINNYSAAGASDVTISIDNASPVRIRRGGLTTVIVKGKGTHSVRIRKDGASDVTGTFSFPKNAEAVSLLVSGLVQGQDFIAIPVSADLEEH